LHYRSRATKEVVFGGDAIMKKLILALMAVGLAVSVVPAASYAAATPKTKAACDKAKMKWDDATKTCSKM
jgi:hypothetical protein